MRRTIGIGLLIFASFGLCANASADLSSKAEALSVGNLKRIVSTLASDDMRGRGVATPDIEKAADFIASEFASSGLEPFGEAKSYRQEFVVAGSQFVGASAVLDGMDIGQGRIIAVTAQPALRIDSTSGFETVRMAAGANLFSEAQRLIGLQKKFVVWVDKSHAGKFAKLGRLASPHLKTGTSVVFVLADREPARYTIETSQKVQDYVFANLVGIIPGKTKPGEFVVFSAHYDHLGVGAPTNGDSIYNGANDNASGIAAVVQLAKYFRSANDNERTIMFVAFTGEELGLLGSEYFSRVVDSKSLVAMINIEMIGTQSKWGRKSAFLTGFSESDLSTIFMAELKGGDFSIYPDPYPSKNLFYRSDNTAIARLGVPAHTISTSKMDQETFYHTQEDEVQTLDFENMTAVVEAIAVGSRSLVSGKATPIRVVSKSPR